MDMNKKTEMAHLIQTLNQIDNGMTGHPHSGWRVSLQLRLFYEFDAQSFLLMM